MKAAYNEKYGPADILEIRDVPRPEIADDQVLVQVIASSVTTADWRLRASAFPGGLWLMGRLMMGLFAPKNKILGHDFAGRVVSVGANVTKFKMGDAVFGFTGGGAHAEYLAIGQDDAIAHKPENLGYDEATALPFGAACALMFLRDFAQIKPGQRVLVTGASGGVGVYGVQLAKYFGAHVTALASPRNIDLVKSLGADEIIDYTTTNFAKSGAKFDLIFDTAGVTSFSKASKVLNPEGAFMPLEMGLKDLPQALFAKIFTRKKVILRISSDRQEDIVTIGRLAENGSIKAIIDSHYTLDNIADAHRRVETRHKTGSVIIDVAHYAQSQIAAA